MTISKKLFALAITVSAFTFCYAQDAINPYEDYDGDPSPSYDNLSGTYPFWQQSLIGGIPGDHDGEYEISIRDFFWWYDNSFGQLGKSHEMEIVSFPFTMDCAFAGGCGYAVNDPNYSSNRYLTMPGSITQTVGQYDSYNNVWTYPVQNGNLYRKTPRHIFAGDLSSEGVSNPGRSLISRMFTLVGTGIPSSREPLPHTIIKHTINLHCGIYVTDDIITSISFYFDNTRGRMRFYPFYQTNYAASNPQFHDLIFVPDLLVNDSYNNYDVNIIPNDIIMPTGTINYYPFAEINANSCALQAAAIPTDESEIAWTLYNPNPDFEFPYAPPYALLTAPLRSYEGSALAGYAGGSTLTSLGGLPHTYFIDNNVNLSDINPTEKVIYNPSEVTVTANNLIFPSQYIFKTIRGLYPTVNEVSDDNTVANGGTFSDPRDVPVTTDLFYEGSGSYPTNDHDYASVYKLQSGSKITVQGCVYIFDAAFDCQTGSELVFENFPTNKNPLRFNILYSGGTVTKRAHDFYFQNFNETRSILKFESDGTIEAGYNVTTGQQGDYTVASGANVTFTSDDAVTLKHGFTAASGSQFVASAVSSVSVPTCTPPQFRLAGYNYTNADNPENRNDLQIIAYPNPTPGVFKVQLKNSEKYTQKEIYVTDMFGKQILPADHNLRSRNVIDLSNHPEGIYFVKVIEGDRMAVKKVIKM